MSHSAQGASNFAATCCILHEDEYQTRILLLSRKNKWECKPTEAVAGLDHHKASSRHLGALSLATATSKARSTWCLGSISGKICKRARWYVPFHSWRKNIQNSYRINPCHLPMVVDRLLYCSLWDLATKAGTITTLVVIQGLWMAKTFLCLLIV